MSNRSITASLALASLVASTALGACSPRSEAGQPPANPGMAEANSTADDVKAFTVGSLSALALRDGALELPNDNEVFGVGRTPAEVGALLSAAGLPTDKLQLSIQQLLVKTADRVLLFDTGAGTNMGASGGKLLASLAAAGIAPEGITDVFISHAHGDHVGGLVTPEGSLAFPNAAIYLTSPEWTFLKEMSAATAASVAIARHPELVAAITPRVAAFAPGADIIPGVVKAVEIAGHTPGHSGYLITSGQSSLLYVGDAMHHFVVSVQKPEWVVKFDTDSSAAAASRSALLAQSAASGQRIHAVHFPFPGLGKIERRSGELVWAPE
jgi:glyoxylase-like metal-dependent hydrolase (beta-lactamase superfamily II)